MFKPAMLIAVVVLASGCATIDPKAQVAPTYRSISATILSVSCVQCHGVLGGYSFDTYDHTMKAVSPGDPDSSRLYFVVSKGKMPKLGTKLSAPQVQAIRDWIIAGAPDN
jgi:mono/diheme cytochrome c family protein